MCVCMCVCVCICVSPVQGCAVLAIVMNRIVFVFGSNDNYTRLEFPDTEDVGATML
jgi:hypothetical protein